MDYLKRSLAPITDAGWDEIDDQAREVLISQLTGRKFVDVTDPQGWYFSAVSEGRLDIKEDDPGKVRYGTRKTSPLVETRTSFNLNIWELDNLSRGAKDLDLSPLEAAAEKAAQFEEDVIYKGLKDSEIKGLTQVSETSFDIPEGPEGIVEAISKGVMTLQDTSIEGPYSMVANRDLWQKIAKSSKGYPLKRHLEDLIDGSIIYNPHLDNALLLSTRGGDYELILGQDFSIGYENHDSTEVKLFLTESFSFRILEPGAVVTLTQ